MVQAKVPMSVAVVAIWGNCVVYVATSASAPAIVFFSGVRAESTSEGRIGFQGCNQLTLDILEVCSQFLDGISQRCNGSSIRSGGGC